MHYAKFIIVCFWKKKLFFDMSSSNLKHCNKLSLYWSNTTPFQYHYNNLSDLCAIVFQYHYINLLNFWAIFYYSNFILYFLNRNLYSLSFYYIRFMYILSFTNLTFKITKTYYCCNFHLIYLCHLEKIIKNF